MESKVMLLKVPSVTEQGIYSSLKQGVSAVLSSDTLLKTRKIIVKANLCKPFPADSGATVDMRVTESLIKFILEQNPGVEIYVVESDASSRYAKEAFRETGYLSLEGRCENLHIVNLSQTDQITIGMDDDRRFEYFKEGLRLSSLFLDCDFFISVGKLKTHEFERFTGILKNQFGCLSTKNKERYHPYLSEIIGDINSVLKPDLCIIDGLIGMEGRGPGFGDPKRMDLLIVGNDPVATDSVAATVMGIVPRSVPHLKAVAKRGIGEIGLESVSISGEKIEEVRSDFTLVPKHVLFLFRLSFKVRKLADLFTDVGKFTVSIGRQLERLGRALYIRTLSEILERKVFRPFVRGTKIPSLIHKILLIIYLALRHITS